MSEVWEDIGYKRGIYEMEIRRTMHENRIKIKFIAGMNKGKVQWIRWDLALPLIKHGIVVELDRGSGVKDAE